VLPGGRNSGQKAQRCRRKKKVGRKNLWPKFGRILPEVAVKGPNKFLKEFPSFTGNDKHSETMTKFILQFY
jgi:hypothetical protein